MSSIDADLVNQDQFREISLGADAACVDKQIYACVVPDIDGRLAEHET